MAPRDAGRRPLLRQTDPRLATYGVGAILAGILAAIWGDAPALRLLVSLTLIVIGFGLIRQAFRIE